MTPCVLWRLVLSFAFVFTVTPVHSFSIGRRVLFAPTQCIVLQSACSKYRMSVAMAYKIRSGELRSRGWINLETGAAVEVCISRVSSDLWILASKPADDFGCIIHPIAQKYSASKKTFCIDTDNAFNYVRYSKYWMKRFGGGGGGERAGLPKGTELLKGIGLPKGVELPNPECNSQSTCHGEYNFEKFTVPNGFPRQTVLLRCP